jgi:hypothetical protein
VLLKSHKTRPRRMRAKRRGLAWKGRTPNTPLSFQTSGLIVLAQPPIYLFRAPSIRLPRWGPARRRHRRLRVGSSRRSGRKSWTSRLPTSNCGLREALAHVARGARPRRASRVPTPALRRTPWGYSLGTRARYAALSIIVMLCLSKSMKYSVSTSSSVPIFMCRMFLPTPSMRPLLSARRLP